MSEGNNVAVNRKYKDRLFNYIFGREENKDWTLSLYNAVNESDYTDPSIIEFNTLEDALYLEMKNDTSFLISDIMSVYEHQSSFNPNMPLRLLGYADELYSGYISRNKLNKYGEKLIKLPIPKLVVFYNGLTDKPDEVILRLSDSFDEEHKDEADIEVTVRMLNINHGRNKGLMERCRPLSEYSWFIEEIRNNQEKHDIITSVNMAVKAMPDSFLIKEFLVAHYKEVIGMLDKEYNEAEVKELFMADGIEIGIEKGIEQTLVTLICKKLAKGKAISVIADEVEESVEYVTRVYEIASKYLPDYDVHKIMAEL